MFLAVRSRRDASATIRHGPGPKRVAGSRAVTEHAPSLDTAVSSTTAGQALTKRTAVTRRHPSDNTTLRGHVTDPSGCHIVRRTRRSRPSDSSCGQPVSVAEPRRTLRRGNGRPGGQGARAGQAIDWPGRAAQPSVDRCWCPSVTGRAIGQSVNLVHMAPSLDSNLSGLGYEGLDADTFVRRLKNRGVEVVADVRLSPISRKKGLSKSALRDLLEVNNIEYVHLRALGNPKDNRAGYAERVGSAAEHARDRFRELLKRDDAQSALDYLNKLAETRTVAVICFECDESHCHRQQVLEAVRGRALVAV